MPTFAVQTLTDAITDVFAACGAARDDARIVAEHLVDAECSGVASHGVMRVPQYVEAVRAGRIHVDARLTVVSDHPSTAVLDGQHGFGQVMARRAMETAIQKAKHGGVGAVTLVNCSHTGRLGSYTAQAARAGMLAMCMVNAGGGGQWVAPFGGTAGRLATNPISFAVPRRDEGPIVVDFATSAVPEGKIRTRHAAGQSIPEGWLIDHRGQPSTNPADLYGPPPGAILPLGGPHGHKGFGLALIVDLFAGALSGAGVCHAESPQEPNTDGVFMLAVRVDAFCPVSDFLDHVRRLQTHVKTSPPADGFEQVVLPGEIEELAAKKARSAGITIDEGVWKTVQETLDELGIHA